MQAPTTTTPAPAAALPRLTRALPRIGVLGIMQELYDEMLPGITERQAAYLRELAGTLAEVADIVVTAPARDRAGIEHGVAELAREGAEGLLVVMLTYGPGLRLTRAITDTQLPVCLANVQPESSVTAAWDMADLTYNQGIHGAQDTANVMVRAGRPFHVVSDDWRAPSFAEAVGVWARAAAAATRWRQLKVAIFGSTMNGMGDIRVDTHSLQRVLGPMVDSLAPGELVRAAAAVEPDAVAALIELENGLFELDPALTREEREDHARMQVGLETILRTGGYSAYSTHFGSIAEDGRFARLPLAAASSLMAMGYGFAAEGDCLTAALASAATDLIGETQFTEMYAMDFAREAMLMSHMGEGNWALARPDRPVRLIKRPLGIGGLDDPPTFLFQYALGPATLATLFPLAGERFRLVVCEGEILDTEELPNLEMPYGFFRPARGLKQANDAWLKAGGPHHQVLNYGHRLEEWRLFCDATGIELVAV
ncbi:MAG: L-arabinose isomerase family protein [Gaiellaceae bacterium]